MLINLISNAIKFTSDWHISIVIKKVEDLEGKVKVCFGVSDDGAGIPKKKQTKIFDNFYQEHTKHSKSYKGTGLGLSIVKRILTAMGTDIHLRAKQMRAQHFSLIRFLQKEMAKLCKLLNTTINYGILKTATP